MEGLQELTNKVRTIPVLGYWELGDICIYWVILLSRDIFSAVTPDAIFFVNDRSGTVHMITV